MIGSYGWFGVLVDFNWMLFSVWSMWFNVGCEYVGSFCDYVDGMCQFVVLLIKWYDVW